MVALPLLLLGTNIVCDALNGDTCKCGRIQENIYLVRDVRPIATLTVGSHCVPLETTPRPVRLRYSADILLLVMMVKLLVEEERRKL